MSRIAVLALLPLGCVKPPPPAAPDPTTQAVPAAARTSGPDDAEPLASLPDAEVVLARAVQALGGRATLDAIETYYSKATVTVQGQALSTVVEVWWQADDFYMRSTMAGLGVSEIWKHGAEIWADDPLHGRRRLEGKSARQATLDASPALAAHWQRYFDTAKTTRERMVDGRALLDVRFAGADDVEVTVGFAQATGLPATHATVRDTPMGALPVTTWFQDYREISGMKTPFRSVVSMSLYEAVVEVERFDVGVPIEPGTFDP